MKQSFTKSKKPKQGHFRGVKLCDDKKNNEIAGKDSRISKQNPAYKTIMSLH